MKVKELLDKLKGNYALNIYNSHGFNLYLSCCTWLNTQKDLDKCLNKTVLFANLNETSEGKPLIEIYVMEEY